MAKRVLKADLEGYRFNMQLHFYISTAFRITKVEFYCQSPHQFRP